MKIHQVLKIGIVVVLSIGSSELSAIDCGGSYASHTSCPPSSPAGNACSSSNNTSTGDQADCEYYTTTAAAYCCNTTAFTTCDQEMGVDGKPVSISLLFTEVAGWCVQGQCNYNTTITVSSVWTQGNAVYQTDTCP